MISYQSVLLSTSVLTVPLNYNFILTHVFTSGATKYFACQMPKVSRGNLYFPEMRRGCGVQTWYLHETWHVAFYTQRNRNIYTRYGCAH